jgi:transcriptional regulator with AAA-type ATPase domain
MEAERQKNQETYAQLKTELEQKYQGQFVVIARGLLIAVAPTLQEALQQAKAILPEAEHRLVFKVGEDYPTKIRVGARNLS